MSETETERASLAAAETENTIMVGQQLSGVEYRDRYDYDRYKLLIDSLNAWRINPLVWRGIELTTEFVIGSGILITSPDKPTNEFLARWQADPVNQLTSQLDDLADELWRSGNLFMLCSADITGMTYWRPIPAETIAELKTYDNDPYRAKRITLNDINNTRYQALNLKRARQLQGFMHYTINRPAGGTWGESDLSPILRWVRIYTDLLLNRAAINKHLQPIYIRTRKFTSQTEKLEYAKSVSVPRPGSQEILDVGESLGALSPMSGAFEAGVDAENLRRMIYVGFGFPPHYFAEPESSTRTTAEAAGTPNFRRLQKRQRKFVEFLTILTRHALHIRAERSGDVNPNAEIVIKAPDISERDNATMAMSASRAAIGFATLYDRGLIGPQDLVDITYKFSGETTAPPTAPKNPIPRVGKLPQSIQTIIAEPQDPATKDPTAQDQTAE